jgi:hypothetical protein
MAKKNSEPFLDEYTAELREFGIEEIPAARRNRAGLCSFIKNRNLLAGKTREERRDLLKETQEKWIHRIVTKGGLIGIVRYILPKTEAHGYIVQGNYKQTDYHGKPTPFRAAVLWNGERQLRVADLETLEPAGDYVHCSNSLIF